MSQIRHQVYESQFDGWLSVWFAFVELFRLFFHLFLFFSLSMKWQKRNNIVFVRCSFDLHTYYTHCMAVTLWERANGICEEYSSFVGNNAKLFGVDGCTARPKFTIELPYAIGYLMSWNMRSLFSFFISVSVCSYLFFFSLHSVSLNCSIAFVETSKLQIGFYWGANEKKNTTTQKNEERERKKQTNHRAMIKLFARHTGG